MVCCRWFFSLLVRLVANVVGRGERGVTDFFNQLPGFQWE